MAKTTSPSTINEKRAIKTVLKLLSGKDQALLVRRNAFLVLNLGLDILDGVRGLDFERDGFPCDSTKKKKCTPLAYHRTSVVN